MRRALWCGVLGASALTLLLAPLAGAGHGGNERKRVRFGHSVQDRPLRAIRLGNPRARRTALVVGEIHGDEPAGRGVIHALRHLDRGFAHVALWTVLTVNPDGHRADQRVNTHGVDLNRNFSYRWSGAEPPGSGYYAGPGPFSEPESRAVRRLVRRIHPDLTVWFHQPWDAVLACGRQHRVESRFAQIAGMNVDCRGENLHGTATSWQEHHFPASNAFVVEFHAGTLSSAELRKATEATAHVAAKGAAR